MKSAAKKDARTFAVAITSAKHGDPLYTQLMQHFVDEMNKAVRGRICTPERMAKLYPIFREINLETDQIKLEAK